jgi:hypothetical protein
MVERPTADRPGFVVFYQDARDGSALEPEDRVYLDLPQIEQRMQDVLAHPLNYFGLVDQFGVTLQFMADGTASVIRVEVPDPTRKGSMAKDATLEECLALVRSAGPSLAELTIPGVTFQPWG